MNKSTYLLLLSIWTSVHFVYAASSSEQQLLALNSRLKQRRGVLDFKSSDGYNISVIDAVTERTLAEIIITPGDKLSDHPGLNINIRKWKRGRSFVPLLEKLTDNQLFLLDKASNSWRVDEPYIINEGTVMDEVAIFNLLPQTLQHQRLFCVITMNKWQRLLSFLCR